jgi:dienelactone hydrolase
MHDGTDVRNSKCPMFFITVPKDAFYDDAKIESCKEAGAKVRVFDGMYHGFVVRGDFANNAAVRAAADEAAADMVAFIKGATA